MRDGDRYLLLLSQGPAYWEETITLIGWEITPYSKDVFIRRIRPSGAKGKKQQGKKNTPVFLTAPTRKGK